MAALSADGTGHGSANVDQIFTNNLFKHNRISLSENGGVIVGIGPIPTTATDGFLYIPGCYGTPTGTPDAVNGRVPLVIDIQNNILYFYSNGAWRDASNPNPG